MEDREHLIGDFILWKDFGFSPRVGVIIAANKANSSQLHDYQKVYYILLPDGQIKGPAFKAELQKI